MSQALRIARDEDWQNFAALARGEGWRVSRAEQRLFQGSWASYAKALATPHTFCGMVTAVAHQRSGWIGNLIVAPEKRGQGYGRHLFEAGCGELLSRKLDSIWLTASPLGRPLYLKHGFRSTGHVERWVHPRVPKPNRHDIFEEGVWDALLEADVAAWGEQRATLLDGLRPFSRAFTCDGAIAVLQQGEGAQLIGPWYDPSGCPRANRRLLQGILAASIPGHELVVDLITSSPLRSLLPEAGFELCGEVELMTIGKPEHVNLGMQVSLASLGSIG